MTTECPRCGCDLAASQFGSEQLNGCHRCGGLWLHCDALNRLVRDKTVSLDDLAEVFRRTVPDAECAGAMACPNCNALLGSFHFPTMPDLPAHVCSTCRCVWLDDGGVERIAVRIGSMRAQAAPPATATAVVSAPAPHAQTKAEEHAEAAEAPPSPEPRLTVSYLVSATCPSCEAANPPASTQCWSCGAAIKSAGEAKRCVRCHLPLLDLAEDDLRFSICAGCGGVWMEDGRLPVLLQLDHDAFTRLRRDVSAIRDQEKARREREEAEHLAGSPYAVAQPAHDPLAAPPSKPEPAKQGGGHGLRGFLQNLGHGHEHHAAVVSHAHRPGNEAEAPAASVLRCPACRYEMHAHEFGSQEPITAYICAHCRAMWLDAGGVTAIYEQVQREGMLCSRGARTDVWARD